LFGQEIKRNARMDKGSLELLLARGLSLEQIAERFRRHPSTVSYWLNRYGLKANGAEKHAAKGAVDEDRLRSLVDEGKSIAQIADSVGRSKATVRYWLRRHGLRTEPSQRRRRQGDALNDGLATLTLGCRRHGESEHALCADGTYRCKRCRSESVARRRRKMKETIVAEAGGGCCICGYDRYIGALEFHHVDPREKRLTLSGNGVTLSMDTLRAEAGKCVLVCSNCHAELEAGVTRLPDTVALIGGMTSESD
jgi:transposase/transcription elongation factor Elf1